MHVQTSADIQPNIVKAVRVAVVVPFENLMEAQPINSAG